MTTTGTTAWKANDIVYAFDPCSVNNMNAEIPQGFKAIMLCGWTEEAHLIGMAKHETDPVCFAPCGGPGDPPDWDSVRGLKGWDFASTPEEIAAIRDMRIRKRVSELEDEIERLEKSACPEKPEKEPGFLGEEPDPVWRCAPSTKFDAIRDAMDCDMTPTDDFEGQIYEWDEFVDTVHAGCINDNDGVAYFAVDGAACSNAMPICYMEMLWVYDKYLVPWSRVPELFEGHDIKVHWFNK